MEKNDLSPEIVQGEQPMATMPLPPHMVNCVAPPPTPTLDFHKAGIIRGTLHNMRLNKMAKAASLEADIAESNNRTVQAILTTQSSLLLFGAEYDLRRKEIDHTIKMSNLEAQLTTEDLSEKRIKNQILIYQMEQEKIDYLQRKKLWEDENGSPSED